MTLFVLFKPCTLCCAVLCYADPCENVLANHPAVISVAAIDTQDQVSRSCHYVWVLQPMLGRHALQAHQRHVVLQQWYCRSPPWGPATRPASPSLPPAAAWARGWLAPNPLDRRTTCAQSPGAGDPEPFGFTTAPRSFCMRQLSVCGPVCGGRAQLLAVTAVCMPLPDFQTPLIALCLSAPVTSATGRWPRRRWWRG